MSEFRRLVDELKTKVRAKHGPYNSWHEAHSVLREEFDEFWEEVKHKESERDPERLLSELVDIVQVAERAAEDFGLVKAEPSNHEDREAFYAEKYNELAIAVINFLTVMTRVTKNPLQRNRQSGDDLITTILIPKEYIENLESLTQDDRVLPAQSS